MDGTVYARCRRCGTGRHPVAPVVRICIMRRALFLLIPGLALCPGVASAHEIRARKPDLKILAASPKLPEGRLGGDGWLQGWIEAGGELKLEQQFLAGQPAAVTVLAAPFSAAGRHRRRNGGSPDLSGGVAGVPLAAGVHGAVCDRAPQWRRRAGTLCADGAIAARTLRKLRRPRAIA